MKYKTKYQRFGILLAMSLLIPFSGKGQSAQQAQELLDAVAEKVSSYQDIEIDFTWNLVNQKEQVDQKTQGSVMLKGEHYRLSMMGMTRVFDGDKLFTIAPEDMELTVSDLDPSEDKSVTPSKLLTFYKEGYTYAWDIKQKVAGKNIQYVKLYPIDSGAEIKNMLLGIDTSTNHIYRLIQTDAKGTQFILTVKSFKPNQKLTPDNFAVDLNQYQEQGYYINTLY
jgi:outer membrane lipoprotein-sorting protein